MTCGLFIASASAQRAQAEQDQRFAEVQRLKKEMDEEFERQAHQRKAQQGMVIDVEAREVPDVLPLPPPDP